jgi:hypothetical protein
MRPRTKAVAKLPRAGGGPDNLHPDESGETRSSRERRPRAPGVASIAVATSLAVVAGLGAGALIFPERLMAVWDVRTGEWGQPSTGWMTLFEGKNAVMPSRETKAGTERPRMAAATVASVQGPAESSRIKAIDAATTSSLSMAPATPKEFVWLPTETRADPPATVAATPAARMTVAPPTVEPLTLPGPAAATPLVSSDIAEWLKRARDLIARGDISGARLLLERAASGADPRALMALAETYDPAMLSRWGARGLKGDTAKARNLYQRAAEAGVAEARTRMLAVR